MNILLRYACLLGLGFASLFYMVSAGAVTGQMMLSSADAGAANPRDLGLWVLGIIVLGSVFSVIRACAGVPLRIRDCYRDHKDKLTTLAMAGVVCFVFIVF